MPRPKLGQFLHILELNLGPPCRFPFPALILPVDSTVQSLYLPRLSEICCWPSQEGPGERGMRQRPAGRGGRQGARGGRLRRAAGREFPFKGDLEPLH